MKLYIVYYVNTKHFRYAIARICILGFYFQHLLRKYNITETSWTTVFAWSSDSRCQANLATLHLPFLEGACQVTQLSVAQTCACARACVRAESWAHEERKPEPQLWPFNQLHFTSCETELPPLPQHTSSETAHKRISPAHQWKTDRNGLA